MRSLLVVVDGRVTVPVNPPPKSAFMNGYISTIQHGVLSRLEAPRVHQVDGRPDCGRENVLKPECYSSSSRMAALLRTVLVVIVPVRVVVVGD